MLIDHPTGSTASPRSAWTSTCGDTPSSATLEKKRVIGPRLTTKQGLAVIEQLGGARGMATASNSKLLRVITKASLRGATDFADAITAALAQQTVVVAGTTAAKQVLPGLAASLRQVLDQRAELAGQVEKVVDTHPLVKVPDLDARYRGQDRSTDPPLRR